MSIPVKIYTRRRLAVFVALAVLGQGAVFATGHDESGHRYATRTEGNAQILDKLTLGGGKREVSLEVYALGMFELNKKEIQEELKQKNLPPEYRERLYQELAETRRARASNATSLIHQSSDIQSLAQERVDTAPANSVDALESPQTPEQWQQVISIQELSIQNIQDTHFLLPKIMGVFFISLGVFFIGFFFIG